MFIFLLLWVEFLYQLSVKLHKVVYVNVSLSIKNDDYLINVPPTAWERKLIVYTYMYYTKLKELDMKVIIYC